MILGALLAPLASLAFPLLGTPGDVEALEHVHSMVRVQRGIVQLAMRDMCGDGSLDLLSIEPGGIGLRHLDEEGRYPTAHDAFLPWPGTHLAWDLSDVDGDGRTEIVMLLDGQDVRAYRATEGTGFEPGELLLTTTSYLPRGVSRMDFVRDVDGGGREDLIVPGAGRYRIYLQGEVGWAEPLEVLYEAAIEYQVGDPDELTSSFGQRVSIPWFSVEDVDGDGRRDLVSETGDQVLVHLADPVLSTAPTWRLDLAALRDELPRRRGLNLDDIFSNFDGTVEWRVADLDGRYPNDLVLQLGSTFKIYRAASKSGPNRQPDQVLKSSGNLLFFFLRDVQGNEQPDLQLVRGERISIGTVLRWLILPGSLDFDLFTYENQSGSFARRPTRRNRVSIEIPRLLSFMDEIDELEDEIRRQEQIPARRFAWDADGERDDVVDVRDGQLWLFHDRAPEWGKAETVYEFDGDFDVLLEQLVLHDLDRMGDGGEATIDLGDLKNWKFAPGAELRDALGEAPPDGRIELPWSAAAMKIVPLDVDGDGRQDFILLGEEDGEGGNRHVVQFLLIR